MNNSPTPPPIPSGPVAPSFAAMPFSAGTWITLGMVFVHRLVFFGVRATLILMLFGLEGMESQAAFNIYQVLFVFGSLLLVPGGLAGDLMKDRRWPMVLGMAFLGVGTLLMGASDGAWWKLAFPFLVLGKGVFTPNAWASLGSSVRGIRAQRVGVFFLGFVLINLAGLAMGLMPSGDGFPIFLILLGTVALVGATIGLVLALTGLWTVSGESERSEPAGLWGGVGILVFLATLTFLVMNMDWVYQDWAVAWLPVLIVPAVLVGILLIALDGRKSPTHAFLFLLLAGISALYWFPTEISGGVRYQMMEDSDLPFQLGYQINLGLSLVLMLVGGLLLVLWQGFSQRKSIFRETLVLGGGIHFLAAMVLILVLLNGVGLPAILLLLVLEAISDALVTPLVLGLGWEHSGKRWRSTGMGTLLAVTLLTTTVSNFLQKLGGDDYGDFARSGGAVAVVALAGLLLLLAVVLYYFIRRNQSH